VGEVVFGIQFQELKEFKSPHTGLLWNRFERGKYPACQEMPPIAHIIEEFPAKPKGEETVMIERLNSLPLPRIFLINGEGDNLIQIQRDRFLQNWRKMKPDARYPRYATLYPEFEKSVGLFNDFLRSEKIGEVKLNQYELTYVNHIPLKIIDNNICLIENIFPDFKCRDRQHFLPKPERFFCRRSYQLPEKKGRLHVVLKQGQNIESGEELFILDLTVRGFSAQMKEWFDIAHDWIVWGFTDLTSNEVQKNIWGRIK
jgi:uncharacterized protein (TIGR04255 family)